MMSIGFTIMPHPKYPDNTTAEKILKMEKIVLQKHPLHRHYNTTGVVVNLWCQGSFVQLITTCQSVVECILGYHSSMSPMSCSIRDNVNVGYSSSRGHVLIVLDYDPYSELFSPGIRRVGDRHCWVYSLPLLPKANQTSFVEANSWALLLNEFDCLHFGVRRISGIALDFHYTAADVYQLHKRVKKAIKSWERGIRQKDDRVHATVLYLLSRKADIFWLHRPQPQSLLWNGYL
uniref:Uncharacterized protein n=1 Tax=Psilocybe cubensis TaxID=181762 RepID=A0A8H8CFM2_PSICU